MEELGISGCVAGLRFLEIRYRGSRKKDREHGADAVDLNRDFCAFRGNQQSGGQLRCQLLQLCVGPRFFKSLQRRDPGGDRQGISGERPCLVYWTFRGYPLHYFPVPSISPHRQPSSDDLSEACQIGFDVQDFLRSAIRQSKAGHYFVKNQKRAVFARELAQSLQKPSRRQHGSHVSCDRFNDYCGNLRPVMFEHLLQRVAVVVWN